MKFIPAFLILLSFTSCAHSHPGVWKTTCDDDGFSLPLDKKSQSLVVNENQIVISVHAKNVSSNKVDIYYDKTLDLGTGGMTLDWENFSETVKLAEIVIKGNEGKMRWYGFFDKSKNKRVWVEQPDFVQSFAKNGVIKLKQCD